MKQINKPQLFFAIATVGVLTAVPAISSGLHGAGDVSRIAGALAATSVGAPKTYVELQSSSPGSAQSGHINVTGAIRGGQLFGSSGSIATLSGNSATFTGTVDAANFTGQHGLLYGEFFGPTFTGTNNLANGATGILGYASSYTGNGVGVEGDTNGELGRGVYGYAGAGGDASNVGVYGIANGSHGSGVYGKAATGVHGVGRTGVQDSVGVLGESLKGGGIGVVGYSGPTDPVYGSIGVYAGSLDPQGFGIFCYGDVLILGSMSVTGSKNFVIDNPANPEEEYLTHACVESDEMKNIYDGLATFGPDGTVKVQLPSWFDSLNGDFRYQLTCVGGYAQVYVAEEISHNAFTIAGGKPGMKVSWQVTGVRKDPSAKNSGFNVVTQKSQRDRGKFLDPAARGLSKQYGIERPKNMAAPYRANPQQIEPR